MINERPASLTPRYTVERSVGSNGAGDRRNGSGDRHSAFDGASGAIRRVTRFRVPNITELTMI